MPTSALIVRVPEAEPLVETLRRRFDPSARLGVPAHITILFPFMDPGSITSDVLAATQAAVGSIRAFAFALDEVGRWPDTTYLAPRPAEPFVELTEALVRRFPECPPYGARHPRIVPHLTVADGSFDAAETAAAELRPLLRERGAVEAKCRAIDLIENSSGAWKTMHVIALSPD